MPRPVLGTLESIICIHQVHHTSLLEPIGAGERWKIKSGASALQDVARTAVKIVADAEGISTAEAEARLKKLGDTSRIQRDVW